MKPTYDGFEAKKRNSYVELPPVGAYVAEIQDVRFVPKDEKNFNDVIEMMIEITEGEYKNRYHEVYKDADEKFGSATYSGVFRLRVYHPGDDDWVKKNFETNLWCVEQCNPGYRWDWNEMGLKGKKIGINVRKYLYTYKDQDREKTEIGKFETIEDVKNGKCKAMKPRDKRKSEEQNDQNFTPVEAGSVSVPW